MTSRKTKKLTTSLSGAGLNAPNPTVEMVCVQKKNTFAKLELMWTSELWCSASAACHAPSVRSTPPASSTL